MMKRMNLLPKEFRPKPGRISLLQLQALIRQSPVLLWAVVGFGLLALVPVFQELSIWRYRFGIGRFERQIEGLRRTGGQLKTQQEGINVQRADLLLKRQQIVIRQQTLIRAHQTQVPVSMILAELVELLPEEVSVLNLNYTGDAMKIIGSCPDIKSVASFMNRLDNSNRFFNTSFTYTQRAAPKTGLGFTFEITTVPILQLMEGMP